MFSSGNKMQKTLRIIIDILNVIIGVAVVILAVLTFINTHKNSWMFTYVFLGGGLLNLLTGIKGMMNDRKVGAIVMFCFAAALFVISILCYRIIGGR